MVEDFNSPGLIQDLIKELTKLPSIGRKSASRMAFFLLNEKKEKVEQLANTIINTRTNIKKCRDCHNYSEGEHCQICVSPRRVKNLICVVEKPEDILLLEKLGGFDGVYHVLGGSLSPLDGIGPEQLNIESLVDRSNKVNNCEVILALNTGVDGEATGMYLQKRFQSLPVKVSRLARGIPVGSDLQYVDEFTMQKALENRVSL